MELSEKQLAECFFAEHGVLSSYEYADARYGEMTIKEVRKERLAYARRLIRRLKKLEPVQSEDHGIFFVWEEPSSREASFEMTTLSEFRTKGIRSQTYAYETARQEEVLGWYVPDTPMNREHVYELMADILFEMSWFGIKQEKLPEFMERLDAAVNETVDRRIDDDMADVQPDHLLSDDDERLDRFLQQSITTINGYCKEKQLMKVIGCLKKEGLFSS